MIWRARHLQDDRLYECYLAAQTGEAVDPRAAEHMADCESCQKRYAELSMFMSDLRADADAQVDEAFSGDHLRAQQAHILRRIEHLGHAARVISFPKHQPMDALHGESIRVAPRWLAAAAAAGLVVGVGVGTVLQSPFAHRTQHAPATAALTRPATTSSGAAQPAEVQPAAAQPVPVDVAPDPALMSASAPGIDANDDFLQQFEFEVERPLTPELRALDDLTPHAREIRFTTASYR